jgi:hypothetical protein
MEHECFNGDKDDMNKRSGVRQARGLHSTTRRCMLTWWDFGRYPTRGRDTAGAYLRGQM